MWALENPEVARAESTIYFRFSPKKLLRYYSHAFKLVAKYGEDWNKSVVFRRETLYIAKKTPVTLNNASDYRANALTD